MTTANIRRLGRELAELRSQVAQIKQPQLAFSSIVGGAITEFDPLTDAPVAAYGEQFDGAHGVMAFTGITPLTPTVPLASGAPVNGIVRWDGLWVEGGVVPSDFTRVEIHIQADTPPVGDVADTLYGTFETPRGGEQSFTLQPGTYWVRLVARNLAGGRGSASDAASFVVEEVVADLTAINEAVAEADYAANHITSTQITDDAVTAPKVAADAILARNIKANEVIAGKLAAGAVIAGNIAAGAVTASTVAAGAITTDKLDANAINGLTITGSVLQTATGGQRMRMRPGTSTALGVGNGVLELFTGNPLEAFPAEILPIADGPNPVDNISLYIAAPEKTGYGGARPFIQMFAKDADNSSLVTSYAEYNQHKATAVASLAQASNATMTPINQIRLSDNLAIFRLNGIDVISVTDALATFTKPIVGDVSGGMSASLASDDLSAGWAVRSGYEFRFDRIGTKLVAMNAATITAAAQASGSIIVPVGGLPAWARPTVTRTVAIGAGVSGSGLTPVVEIRADGSVRFFNGTTGAGQTQAIFGVYPL